MGLEDLVFEDVAEAEVIFDPLRIQSAVSRTVRVTNQGEDDLHGLGMYLQSGTSLGDLDAPADNPPETDYQDLLTWGTKTDGGVTLAGGMKLTLPQNIGANQVSYITRTAGATARNKLPFKDLAAGESAEFSILLETPSGVTSRRLYINLTLE